MIKKMLLLTLLAVSITGCVDSPYDNHHRHPDRDGRYDRPAGDKDWNNRPHGDKDWNNNPRPNGYPTPYGQR